MSHPRVPNSDQDFSGDFIDAWEASHKDLPKLGAGEKFLNKIEDGVTLSQGEGAIINAVLPPVKALVQTTGIADAIEKGINGFLDGMPILMKALDEVSKIHPFISVAVLAFKAVYTLEAKRRDNDKKITALYVEMRDMMAVLLQLRHVQDVDLITPNGESIKGRLQGLSATTAQQIKSCGNACDTYSKKKLVVKIIAGPVWNEKLASFAQLFTKRRQEFKFSLTIHTAVGIDEANIKLSAMNLDTQEIKQKMEVMLQLFQKFITPEEQEMSDFIKSKGGKSALQDDKTIKELIDREAKRSSGGPDTLRNQNSTLAIEPKDLRREISEDPEQAIKSNAEMFDHKFEIQRRQIEEDIRRAIHREGDRIISAVTSGPHDRIIDPDIYEFWKEMNWRGTVKGRNFVLVLRDYYYEKREGKETQHVQTSDNWALKYIDFNRVHLIQEAFDDDASGFITIQEVNNLTKLRPLDWSLPHWIAYWAIGWQVTATEYCKKIDEIFAAMFHLVDKVKPAIRRIVKEYLNFVWRYIQAITKFIETDPGTDFLKSKFESWVTAEEGRLRKNLEGLRYRIDTSDTVSLITGPGRIEMYIFPLMYLMLKRHLAIISLGQTHLLAQKEIDDATESIIRIVEAAFLRVERMRDVFKQRRLDAKVQFKSFALGMFVQLNDEANDHATAYSEFKKFPGPPELNKDILPKEAELDSKDILNYPPRSENNIDYSAYEPVAIQTQQQWTGADATLGTWYGIMYTAEGLTDGPMMCFTLERDKENENACNGTTVEYLGGSNCTYKVEGLTVDKGDGIISLHIDMRPASVDDDSSDHNDSEGDLELGRNIVDDDSSDFNDPKGDFELGRNVTLDGRLDVTEGSIRGEYTNRGVSGEFVFKRSPEFMRFYPAPVIIRKNNGRARWTFALHAILYAVKRNLWSWSFFAERSRYRKRYIELATREFHGGKPLDSDLESELSGCYTRFSNADIRFYASLINRKLDMTGIHVLINCDNCGSSRIENGRIICINCGSGTSLDLCDDPDCATATVRRDDLEKPHVPTHDVFKVYTTLHWHDYTKTEQKAKDALSKARKLLSGTASETENSETTCSGCKKKVYLSPPCWTCTECEGLFICVNCDLAGVAFTAKHERTHAIVRCQPVIEDKSTEQRMEDRLIAMEDRLTRVEKTLHELLQSKASSVEELST